MAQLSYWHQSVSLGRISHNVLLRNDRLGWEEEEAETATPYHGELESIAIIPHQDAAYHTTPHSHRSANLESTQSVSHPSVSSAAPVKGVGLSGWMRQSSKGKQRKRSLGSDVLLWQGRKADQTWGRRSLFVSAVALGQPIRPPRELLLRWELHLSCAIANGQRIGSSCCSPPAIGTE